MLQPGAAPTAVARSLGIHVSVRTNLGDDVRGCIDPLLRSIYVAPYSHRPRLEWVVAHELAELELHEHLGDEHEDVCQGIAAALMMPAREFRASAESCGWNLATLRRWWPHCSWQALARRVPEVAPGFAATVWEGSRALRRHVGSLAILPGEADELNAFVAAEAAFSGRHSDVCAGGIEARAWFTGGRRAVTLCRAA